MEWLAIYLFLAICLLLMLGFPVAFTLAGTSLAFAGFAIIQGVLDSSYLWAMPERLFGIMNNQTLTAVPLFILMGVLLEKSQLAERLLSNMSQLMGNRPGGLAIAVIVVGALLAASTGIVGATVVTMGLISLPSMMQQNYRPTLATGVICATGTLGQIIPPSIALVLLGDVLSNAYHQAQLNMGIFSPEAISVGDLFLGAILPGLILVALYIAYVLWIAYRQPADCPAKPEPQRPSIAQLMAGLLPPIVLIMVVLGSILVGAATPTEAAGVGAFGALLLAWQYRQLSLATLQQALLSCTKISAMVFTILIGATMFSLVFRGLGGDELVQHAFNHLPGGRYAALAVVMLCVFLLGFILDFIEITFVVVPIVGPILLMMGFDPVWLGIMLAINLQTSFLTPPFGFALFYLRSVVPADIRSDVIYRGVIPFILMQLGMLILLSLIPGLATWLPQQVLGR
ncbi:MAG: TRAP transporter large permease subunit [Pseudomonadales bacterium]|nr:TRAP transporter large permease subunit [Pseudomonadales bacterium]